MKVDLLYGRSYLTVDLPDQCEVTLVRKPAMPLVDDPAAALERALSTSDLQAQIAASVTACILVCDITRPVPNHLFLRPLIERLLAGGIAAEQITILVATGLHRPNEGEELAAVIGDDWVLDNIHVANHDARDADAHVDLGRTTRNTPVKLDRRFVEADLRIATGLVEPHFMAGYSGGRKVVAPGIAHADTIRTFHSARFMGDPLARQCNLQGNPLHEEQLEIMAMLRRFNDRDLLALNTVIDDTRRLSFINFGKIEQSHLAAVEFVHQYCTVELPRRYPTVVSSAAGFPLDQTYYQTVKGMVTPMDILAEDATLIVASECSEGLGSDAYRESQRRLLAEGAVDFLKRIHAKRMADIDEWETQMQLKSQHAANVKLFSSGLAGTDRELTGVDLIDSIEDAVAESMRASGDNAVAVIPEGPYIVPQLSA